MKTSAEKSFERSTRKVFHLFLDSKIQRKKQIRLSPQDYIGVDIELAEEDTRMALFMGKNTINSLKKTLTGSSSSEERKEYDIMSEMASLIVGTALASSGTALDCTAPRMTRPRLSSDDVVINFDSKFGPFFITLGQYQ